MKFEELLPKLRKGKIGYIKRVPEESYYKHWVGKDKYCIFYFKSYKDFKQKYPNTKLYVPDALPKSEFIACYMKSGHTPNGENGLYNDPKALHFDFYFYSEVIVQSDWEII